MPKRRAQSADDVLATPVGDLLEDLSREEVATAGGSAAALSAAFAAALATMVGRASRPQWQDAGGAIARAEELRARLCDLAATDAQAYSRARTLLLRTGRDRERHGAAVAPTSGSEDPVLAVDGALAAAAFAPLAVAEAAAEVAAMCAWAAVEGNADHRADAVVGTLLACAAAQSAAHLVGINLGAEPGGEMITRAEAAVRSAAEACAQIAVS